jgi:hypothetical protein
MLTCQPRPVAVRPVLHLVEVGVHDGISGVRQELVTLSGAHAVPADEAVNDPAPAPPRQPGRQVPPTARVQGLERGERLVVVAEQRNESSRAAPYPARRIRHGPEDLGPIATAGAGDQSQPPLGECSPAQVFEAGRHLRVRGRPTALLDHVPGTSRVAHAAQLGQEPIQVSRHGPGSI